MQAVDSWTGRKAHALQRALRMTNEAFAEYLGVATRTVAYWHKRPNTIPRPFIQELLDTALERASGQAKARFAQLLSDLEGDKSAAASTSDLNRDERERLVRVQLQPSRLDAPAIDSLAHVLAGQRRLEDSLGPAIVLSPATSQLDAITRVLREARGKHRDALARVVAEWTSFVGWLHIATNQSERALEYFERAVDLADEVGDGVLASTAISFQGHLARLQGRPLDTVRASMASLATPGIHSTQRVYDLLQAAHGYADLGNRDEARRFLDQAADLAGDAGEPPPSVYWYTEPFFRLNIGLAQVAIGEYRDAVQSLESGLAEIPADQRNAEWLDEYRQALSTAKERA